MSKSRKRLISATEPLATAAGIRSPVEQLQDLNALSISVVTVCADTSGTDGGLADDTAINTAGGFVKITGTGFRNTSPTTIVYINGVTATYNYLNSTSIVVTVPAATAGTTASLIVFNGSTVGSIWAAGISYSGFPSWTTTAATNLGVVVSTQLVAVGDAPLVYTFVSGTLPPNCTISSSGLLSGTVTGVSTNAIYTFTVAVTDAQNQNVSQSIVYTIVVSDQYYRYTSLHISGDSNPTWITDASTNALAVTPTGSPQATTFSPLEAGYYGNSFNGSSDYLTATSSSLAGLFTVEFWLYKNAATGAISIGDSINSTGIEFTLATTLGIYSNNAYTLGGGSGPTLPLNQWMHIALARDTSNLTRLFLNGTQVGSTWSTTATFSNIIRIGIEYYNSAIGSSSYYINGYVSNLRILNGTCLYTTTFTPPTTALTAITNTSLLTCQSNRFIDNSAAPATITVAGTPKVVSSNPFNLPAGLAAYGSGYFNGTSYAVSPSNTVFGVGTGDFTIEAWIYPLSWPAAGNYSAIMQISGTSIWFGLNSAGFGLRQGNVGNIISYATNPTPNAWTHVAVARIGTTCTLYYNGVSVATATSSASFAVGAAYIAADETPGNYFTGYISNARLVKGTAVYTSNFTPSTTPLTAITNTVLLTLQTNVPHNNSQFRDTSPNNFLVTRYGNPTQGSFSPFTKQYPYSTATVGGSVYFDSTAGDYLNIADPLGTFNFGSGNFTVEAWVYAKSGQNVNLWGNGSSGSNWVAFYTWTQAEFVIAIGGSLSIDVLTGTNSIVNDQWSHVALVRNADVFTIYINGIRANSSTRAGAVPYYDATNTYFGGPRWPGDTASSNGYMSNLRIVKGTAVYTSNFTPSTTPLTAISGTVLLMPFTNAAVYDNTMLNNFETVGDIQVNTSTLKYGTGALKFDGTGDYITVSGGASSLHSIQSGAFTVEMWIYRVGNSSGSGTYDALLGSNNVGSAVWGVYVNKNTLAVSFYSSVGLVETTTTISNSVWTHIAVSRTTGNNLQIFINGVSGYSASNTGIGTLVNPLYIGADVNNNTFNGYIDELRITKGYARYTAAFTPFTGPYSVSAPFGTSILPSKSLRFRASASAYLSRTPAVVSNQQTWTWSGWVKRGSLTSRQNIFGAADSGFVTDTHFEFYTADQLRLVNYVSSTQMELITTQVFRDPAAWYHIVVSVDTTQAASSNRAKIYVNGSQVTSFSTATYPSQNLNTQINGTLSHGIGRAGAYNGQYFDGEMAEVNFVDGLALDPTMFGAYSTYGQWLPISYAGYQGANGFYLPFNAATTTTSANYLLVGGGGGGGQVPGGGGGGGGFRTGSSVTLDPTSVYAISVGAGGAGSTATWPSAANAASPGGGSTFNSLTAAGGGRGGADGSVQAAGSGGSGGGASGGYQNFNVAGGAGNTPSTSPSQGNSGGNSSIGYVAGTVAGAGGGGGAGGAGSPGSVIVTTTYAYGTGTSGDGGAGAVSSISGTSVTYAGGGGGGGASATAAQQANAAYRYLITAGAGGTGGGAAGTTENVLPIAATANLGGGGGGSGFTTGYYGPGGAGGSGVVIISYSGTQKFYGGNVTSVGGNTIHTFTTSGSLTGIFGDQSGNGNNWTPNNINVSTPGPTYDLLTDVPTLTSATAANYCVLLQTASYMGGQSTITDGNLNYLSPNPSSNYASSGVRASIPFASGKFYWEALITLTPGANGGYFIGVTDSAANLNSGGGFYSGYFWGYNVLTGAVQVNGSTVATVATSTLNDIIGLAYDRTAGTMSVYKNNTLLSTQTATPSGAGGMWVPSMIIDQGYNDGRQIGFNYTFGQRPFTYTPPANFLALNTYNI